MVTTKTQTEHIANKQPPDPINRARKAQFEGIGWKIRLQQKRSNYFLTVAKEIVLGNALKRGDDLFYYLVDCEGRKALLVFLDSQERMEDARVFMNESRFFIAPT